MKSRSSGSKQGVVRELFATFLRLGLTSFGGPIARYAYFRRTFVEERKWLDESTYARIVAFCSVLPGPTSSQVGMLVGFTRGGDQRHGDRRRGREAEPGEERAERAAALVRRVARRAVRRRCGRRR